MIPWQFLAFTAIMGGLLYLHFYFAHSRWRRVRGANPSDIDVNYVRREDYFAQSFRCKAKGWLELPSSNGNGTGERIITKGREHIRVSGPQQLGDREQSADILVIEGGFACGAACQLLSEIYAYGEAEIGTGSRLQAIAADRDLTLGDNVTVARWADSGGELTMGRACVVRSRVTARKAPGRRRGSPFFLCSRDHEQVRTGASQCRGRSCERADSTNPAARGSRGHGSLEEAGVRS